MKSRFVLSLLVAALAAIPTLAHADSTQWAVMRAYALADGRVVAVAVPGEWREVGGPHMPGKPLRFVDESGVRFEIPVAVLAQASVNKPLLWAQDMKKLAHRMRRAS
jgi:hypothetical protein